MRLSRAPVSLALLLRQERRTPFPLLPIGLLRQPAIWRSDALAACHGAALVSLITLLPIYLRLRFALSTWAFTFSFAAVASTALLWIGATHPAGHRVYSYLVLG